MDSVRPSTSRLGIETRNVPRGSLVSSPVSWSVASSHTRTRSGASPTGPRSVSVALSKVSVSRFRLTEPPETDGRRRTSWPVARSTAMTR